MTLPKPEPKLELTADPEERSFGTSTIIKNSTPPLSNQQSGYLRSKGGDTDLADNLKKPKVKRDF